MFDSRTNHSINCNLMQVAFMNLTLDIISVSLLFPSIWLLHVICLLFHPLSWTFFHFFQSSNPTLETFQELLTNNALVFYPKRTAKALYTHWQLMKQYQLISDQTGHYLFIKMTQACSRRLTKQGISPKFYAPWTFIDQKWE